MSPTNLNTCRCCGSFTLNGKAPGTYEVCPVCGWEDNPIGAYWDRSNDVTLREAQRNFIEFGACEKAWLDEVRAPTEAERRRTDWQTADMLQSAVIGRITSAFDGIPREDGVTLHEADAIDDYRSEEECRAARKLDRERRWQDVPDEDIEAYPSILSFLDATGFRYYIAAFMVWSLKHYMTSDSLSSDYTIYALCPNRKELRDRKTSQFSLLNEAQSKATCSFLRFMVDHGDGHADDAVAREALEKYWGEFGGEDHEGEQC